MAWRISGTYVASCSCNLICPCPVDGPPTSPDGECRGVLVFHVADGKLDDTDLSGTTFALCNHFPSNLTAGNWKLGTVVDEGASDEQTGAIEKIVKGEEGGPFADFAALTDEWLGPSAPACRSQTVTGPPAPLATSRLPSSPSPDPRGATRKPRSRTAPSASHPSSGSAEHQRT